MTEIRPAPTADPPPLTLARWAAGIVVRWRLAVAAGLVVVALAALSLVLIPPSYRSGAAFVTNSSSSARLSGGGLGGAGMLGGIAAQLGVSSLSEPSESPAFYDRLLHSRELLTRLLQSRFADAREDATADSARLVEILEVSGRDERRRIEAGVKLLDKAIVSEFDNKTNIVSLRFDSASPELSAAVVNRAMELVTQFNREQRTARLRSRRLFLEERVAQARADLQQGESTLRYFYEQNRSWRTSPSLVYEEQQLSRRVDLTSDLYLALQREYNASLLDEFNSAALITVVDAGVPARKPQWPRYGVLLMTATFVGSIVGIAVAGAASVLDDWNRRNPDAAVSFRDAVRQARREIGSTLRRPRPPRPRRVA